MSLVVPLPTVGGHNYFIHGIAAVFVSWLFTWTLSGVAASFVFASITQAIDTLRLRQSCKNRISQAPEDVRQELLTRFGEEATRRFGQMYLIKVLWYSLITLLIAYLVRIFTA